MKGFLRSRLVLTLAALVMIAAAVAIPLSSFIGRSHAANSTPSCTNHPPGPGPYNSCINTDSHDTTNVQSETTIAVSSTNSPGLTVMVGYNDFHGELTGYSYSFDGGTSWTDAGALPVYKDSAGYGHDGGDPALTVDKNGTFYFAQIVYTADHKEFIGMSKCGYSSSTGKIGCGRPMKVSASVIPPHFLMDKPAITYDPVNNRVYVTWTSFALNSSRLVVNAVPQLRYYNISTNSFSTIYSFGSFANGNGTDPVVTSSGLVYVFFLKQATQGDAQAIVYFTFNNGTITTHTLASIQPAASVVTACGPDQEAFTTQAFAKNHYARTNEFPAAIIDSSGNIDVVWEAAPPFGGGAGYSVIWVATIPSGGGTPYIQVLPDKQDSTSTFLIQWQPAIAFAGGTNTLAVTYFQVIQLADGSYQIERDQVTAPASSVPTFGAAKLISTVSWKAVPTNFDPANPCYEGDYSASVSTPTANVVWSYWGDNRDVTSGIGPQADVYGLFVSVQSSQSVYFGSDDSYVYALNATNHALRWRYLTGGHIDSSPAVVNGVVYIGSQDSYVYALNATDGSLIWRYQTGNFIESTPAVVNGVVYIGSGDFYVYALNASNGSLLWRYQTGGEVLSGPAVVNGVVYIGSGYPGDTSVYALNASNGTLLWRYQTGSYVYSSPAVVSGVLYIGSNDSYVYALNASSGTLLWRYQTGGFVRSSPTVVNGVVYVDSFDQYLYALNATNGSLLWRSHSGGDSRIAPAVVNGVVYTGGAGIAYAFNATNGSLLWQQVANAQSEPTVDNGVVYIGTSNGLSALKATDGSLLWNYPSGSRAFSSPVVAP